MSNLEANVALTRASEFLAIRITEGNLEELTSYFGRNILKRVEGEPAVSWREELSHPGETIVFSLPGNIIGIYVDEELQKLFEFTGEKRSVRRSWPTADLIVINEGYDVGKVWPIEPGTIALRDDVGDYFTRNYGFLCKGIDKIDDWAPIDPHKETP